AGEPGCGWPQVDLILEGDVHDHVTNGGRAAVLTHAPVQVPISLDLRPCRAPTCVGQPLSTRGDGRPAATTETPRGRGEPTHAYPGEPLPHSVRGRCGPRSAVTGRDPRRRPARGGASARGHIPPLSRARGRRLRSDRGAHRRPAPGR